MTVLLMLGLTLSPLHAGTTRAQPSLTLPEQVEVDGDEVALGQMAVITGADAALTRQLQGVIVGRTPLPGNSRTVSRDYIALRIRQSGVDPSAILMSVPDNSDARAACGEFLGDRPRNVDTRIRCGQSPL